MSTATVKLTGTKMRRLLDLHHRTVRFFHSRNKPLPRLLSFVSGLGGSLVERCRPSWAPSDSEGIRPCVLLDDPSVKGT